MTNTQSHPHLTQPMTYDYPFRNARNHVIQRHTDNTIHDEYIDCDVNHPQYGWVPHTVSKHENATFFAKVLAALPTS